MTVYGIETIVSMETDTGNMSFYLDMITSKLNALSRLEKAAYENVKTIIMDATLNEASEKELIEIIETKTEEDKGALEAFRGKTQKTIGELQAFMDKLHKQMI